MGLNGLSIRWVKAEYAIGLGIGVLFVVLGIASIVYFFTVKQTMGHSMSFYGNYLFAGLACLIFASGVIRMTLPMFLPLKKTYTKRICPYCGAIVDKDAAVCEKCKIQLD